MAGKQSSGGKAAGTPASMPEGTPSLASPNDHSWTLQSIMEMQKSVGIMGEKLDRLSGDMEKFGGRMDGFGEKLDKIKHWQSLVSGGAIVVAAVVAIVWSIITFVPWDRVHIDTSPKAAVKPTK
jgi:hypothetical protein